MEHEHLNEEEREKLRLENEILKLKMQAEFGAMFGETSPDMSPEMEHAFLKNVMQFEQEWMNRKIITVYELVGKPSFKPMAELNDDEVKQETRRLLEHMAAHKVVLEAKGRYTAEVIYQFITEELFHHETDDMRASGMTKHFSYEEFHPNHRLDIEEGTHEFLKNWFEQSFDEHTLVLTDQLLLLTDPTKPPVFISKEDVLSRMKKVFDSYQKLDDCQLALIHIDVQWDEVQKRGMGFSEGGVKYNAVLESGEVERIEGPFKLYFSNEDGFWQVIHFIFPQFKWPNEE